MIAQIAIGNGDLYTRTHARDNIMVSLKIAPPFYGRIVIGKSSAAVVLRGRERGGDGRRVKSHFYSPPFDPRFYGRG